MSRRVFDVGLDMGRIRNGLKQSKDGKRSKTQRLTAANQDQSADDDSLPAGQNTMVQRLKTKKSNPTMNGQTGHEHDQADATTILPSTKQNADDEFPLPPSHRSSPDDATRERSLHSSQLNTNYDPNDAAQRLDHTRVNSDNGHNFDLKPPPPNLKVKHIDTLSEKLFSGDHLRLILKDPSFFLRFTAFLNRYKPHCAPILVRYLEAQKAIKAVEYANALAETIKPAEGEHPSPCAAASIDPRFEARLQRSFDTLVYDALPAYITNSLTKVVTESMVREITGTGMPVMRELVGGLAEVFCLADPSIEDCPIVYASEEFYRTTRYSRDDVLGRNCRFLQGPKTEKHTIQRISSMIKSGQESCETVLNYRRDGSPFMNLLLTAPLYDNRGTIRYFIGAQIDVSGLIEDGRGLDSFERLLAESRPKRNRESEQSDFHYPQKHLQTLNEFGQMLSVDESSVFQRHSRANSATDNASSFNFSGRQTQSRRDQGPRQPRRVLGNEEDGEEKDKNSWALTSTMLSGRLPGVYQNYILVRPFPSLRIIFVSPALRIPGLLQSPFLSRIGGPAHVREGLSEAFEQGAAVTAKVTWLPHGNKDFNTASVNNGPSSNDGTNGDSSRPSSRRGGPPGDSSRTRYISCTPLLGSDDQVGVWMIVMVENELVTGSLASREKAMARYTDAGSTIPRTPSEYEREDPNAEYPTTPQRFERTSSAQVRENRKGKVGSEGGRLYAEFMRNGGTPKQSMESPTPPSAAMGDGAGPNMNVMADGTDGEVMSEGRIEELVSPTEEKGRIL